MEKPIFVRRLVSLFLTVSFFLFNAAYTNQIGAFFPKEAERKGLSKTTTGVITGINDAVALVLGFFIHHLNGFVNLKTAFWGSYLVLSLTIIAFGLLTFIHVQWVYIIVAVLIRVVTGAMNCAICAVVLPMTFQLFPEYRGQVTGAIQLLFEGGALLGPLIGSVFFKLDGFYLPFVVLGSTSLLFALMSSAFVLPHQTQNAMSDEMVPLNPGIG